MRQAPIMVPNGSFQICSRICHVSASCHINAITPNSTADAPNAIRPPDGIFIFISIFFFLCSASSVLPYFAKISLTVAIPSANAKPYPNVSTGVTFFPSLRRMLPSADNTSPVMMGLIKTLMP